MSANSAIDRREAQEAKTSIRNAAGKPDETVSVFPEPKPETEAARADAMWSIPRKELRGAAMRGTPGAADVLQNTGRPVLFEPRGVIAAANPEFTALRESIPRGNPTPFQSIREVGASGLRPEVQAIATPSKAMQVPEWMAQERSYELQEGARHLAESARNGGRAGRRRSANQRKMNEEITRVIESHGVRVFLM